MFLRQLIQELRLKQESKTFPRKEKKVEMQGESADEHTRGKGTRIWQQRQPWKCKTTPCASKQVNPKDGRGAYVSTLPSLDPIRGGRRVLRKPLLRAQTH